MITQQQYSNSLISRIGARAAAHPWRTLFAWLVFIAASVTVGTVVTPSKLTDTNRAVGEAQRGLHTLNLGGFSNATTETVLVRSSSASTHNPLFAQALRAVALRLGHLQVVHDLRTPLTPSNPTPISADGHSALVQFTLSGDARTAAAVVGPVQNAVASLQRAHPGFVITESGDASMQHDLNAAVNRDFSHAELTSVPLTILILLIAFGALVAAGVPVLLGLGAVVAAIGLVTLPSQIWPIDDETSSIILLIGLAVGVDYALFYIARHREERRAGRTSAEALAIATRTSGRAIGVSGLTVIAAMAGMLLAGTAVFTQIGIATMLVVAAAVASSATALPAILALLGDRIDSGGIPFLRRHAGESRVWRWLVGRTLRRPGLAALISTGVLVALAAPTLGIRLALPGVDALPQSLPSVTGYNAIQRAFPGATTTATVVVQGHDLEAASTRRAFDGALGTDAIAHHPTSIELNSPRTVAKVEVPIAGTGTDAQSTRAIDQLRSGVVRRLETLLPNTHILVTGGAAANADFTTLVDTTTPLVLAAVLGFAFVLMLITFRSIVIAAKTVVLNLLSVLAAYGIVVAIFQHSFAEGILGYHSHAAVVTWLPIFMFAVLFGLSMDYHVFILSRIREAHDAGLSTNDAISEGIAQTGRVVTSAALVMVAVFAVFASLSQLDIKQLSVGLAASILIDATIVRGVLLPASMALLGDWNWYLPHWLCWLPRFHVEPTRPPTPDRA